MKLFGFKPESGDCVGDAMPFYHGGEWHVFYLKPPKDAWDPIERSLTTMAHVKSADLLNWIEMPDCFGLGKEGDADERGCWTGSVIERGGIFHFFYTGYDPKKGQQNICKALSSDLINWDKITTNPILEADPEHYELGDWRDPFVYWDEQIGYYRMLIVARSNQGPFWSRGCIAVATSNDLESWQLQKPEASRFPKHQTFCPECPEIFQLGDYWYYVVSRFSEDQQTIYFVSQNQDGPWERRRLDTVEGRRFYAAKSSSDGIRRVTFAWIPFRQHKSDNGTFCWGGTFGSPRELVSNPDGTLTMRMLPEIYESYTQAIPLRFAGKKWGQWEEEDNIIKIKAENEYAYGLMSVQDVEDVLMETILSVKPDGTKAGLLIEADEDMRSGYFLSIDPLREQVVLNKWPQDQDFHWETWLTKTTPELQFNQEKNNPLVHRTLPYLPDNHRYSIKVLRKGSGIECYVADQVCASFRIYKKSKTPFGIFVEGGVAEFDCLELRRG
ncbi:MAG: hypothetical protein O2887_16525 [Bacteroidetes bacterium]|nr:hypothetical protein [Bacteroidota bacterium]MDA1122069.1 hypothetical protein [Bacteroidota bacterium]